MHVEARHALQNTLSTLFAEEPRNFEHFWLEQYILSSGEVLNSRHLSSKALRSLAFRALLSWALESGCLQHLMG